LTEITYGDGKGDSVKTAISISGARTGPEGVRAEYLHIAEKLGERGKDWELDMQRLIRKEDRRYDRIDVKLADGTKTLFHFEITEFFGKH